MENESYSTIIYENFFIVLNKIFNTASNTYIKAIFKPNSLYFQIQPSLLFPILLFLKYNSYALFRSLIDITVYDFFSNMNAPSTRFHIRYFLLSHHFNTRLTIMFTVSQIYKPISSITLIYKNAMWSEREI
jgi:NADH dehydrogenase (ubiquinone) Fe-S protein 3